MAEVELNLTDEQFQTLLRGERGLAAVLQAVLNRVLEAEMTEHLEAAPHERTSSRRGHRNGYYERDLSPLPAPGGIPSGPGSPHAGLRGSEVVRGVGPAPRTGTIVVRPPILVHYGPLSGAAVRIRLSSL